MCLIVFSYKQHPTYDLIFAANRDEFYERPTREAHFWDDHPSILAGKDMEAGGTWMGITRQGSFAALTNFRDLAKIKQDAPSRGHLVRDFLVKDSDPQVYMQQVHQKGHRYNGFNLLAGNLNKLLYYSNQQREIRPLPSGLYGLSNHLLDTPWHKVEQATTAMSELLQQGLVKEEQLFRILKNDVKAPEDSLPNTGLSPELERAVSSVFIETEGYGTRNSTVLLVDKEGRVMFSERLYGPEAAGGEETNRYEFTIRSQPL